MKFSDVRGYATALGFTPKQIWRSYQPRSAGSAAVYGGRLGYWIADKLSDGYMSGSWSYKPVTGVRSGNRGRAGSVNQYVGSAPEPGDIENKIRMPAAVYGRVRSHKGRVSRK